MWPFKPLSCIAQSILNDIESGKFSLSSSIHYEFVQTFKHVEKELTLVVIKDMQNPKTLQLKGFYHKILSNKENRLIVQRLSKLFQSFKDKNEIEQQIIIQAEVEIEKTILAGLFPECR